MDREEPTNVTKNQCQAKARSTATAAVLPLNLRSQEPAPDVSPKRQTETTPECLKLRRAHENVEWPPGAWVHMCSLSQKICHSGSLLLDNAKNAMRVNENSDAPFLHLHLHSEVSRDGESEHMRNPHVNPHLGILAPRPHIFKMKLPNETVFFSRLICLKIN